MFKFKNSLASTWEWRTIFLQDKKNKTKNSKPTTLEKLFLATEFFKKRSGYFFGWQKNNWLVGQPKKCYYTTLQIAKNVAILWKKKVNRLETPSNYLSKKTRQTIQSIKINIFERRKLVTIKMYLSFIIFLSDKDLFVILNLLFFHI